MWFVLWPPVKQLPIIVLRKKGSKTKKRMKEEEIEKGDCRPQTWNVFFEILSDLNQAVPNLHADESETRQPDTPPGHLRHVWLSSARWLGNAWFKCGRIQKKKKKQWPHTVESVFYVQNFVWKNYPLLLVESTSNFTWTFFWRNFSSQVIYFCQFFFASMIFVKLLFISAGLDVFPSNLMKKEACDRVRHVKISRNWSLGFVWCLCACLKNRTIGRQWKMCSTGLNACNLGYRGQHHRMSHRCHGKHGEHRKKLYTWHEHQVERGESCKPTEPASGEMIFPGPPFPPKIPPNGLRAIFSPLPQKMPILFHSGNKRQFKLCSLSVSNYQNQLVEAGKLFKKSHIFAWFHCTSVHYNTYPLWPCYFDLPVVAERLYTYPPDDTEDYLPSPEALRGMILVKVKRWAFLRQQQQGDMLSFVLFSCSCLPWSTRSCFSDGNQNKMALVYSCTWLPADPHPNTVISR